MRFSVIVPIYNVDKYIEGCIKSIISQSFSDFELILVDDGSPDSSPEICDRYALLDNRIKVIHKKNGGPTSARKAGAAKAKGEYVICIDGDDKIEQGYFEYADDILKNDYDVVCFNFYYDDGKIYKNSVKSGSYPINAIIDDFCIKKRAKLPNEGNICYSIWSKVVKKTIYVEAQNNIPDKVSLGEDLLLSLLIFNKSKNIFISDRSFYIYRTNPTSITNVFSKKKISQYLDISNSLLMLQFYPQKSYCYAFQSIMKILSGLTKSSKSYKNFLDEIKSLNDFTELKKMALKTNNRYLNLKYFFMKTLLTLNFYRLIYGYYKNKN